MVISFWHHFNVDVFVDPELMPFTRLSQFERLGLWKWNLPDRSFRGERRLNCTSNWLARKNLSSNFDHSAVCDFFDQLGQLSVRIWCPFNRSRRVSWTGSTVDKELFIVPCWLLTLVLAEEILFGPLLPRERPFRLCKSSFGRAESTRWVFVKSWFISKRIQRQNEEGLALQISEARVTFQLPPVGAK